MSQTTIEIADSKGTTMQLVVRRPLLAQNNWRALDKGKIRYNSGLILNIKASFSADEDFYLLDPDEDWGILLREYITWGVTNDTGVGVLTQPWVLTMEPGPIQWSVV